MACTMRLAADTAKFGQPEVTLGLTPGLPAPALPRLVGKGRAMELVLGGGMIDAAEAFRIGLVNRVVPAASLPDEARALAQAWRRTPMAMRYSMEAISHGLETSFAEGCFVEASLFGLAFATRTCGKGPAHFSRSASPSSGAGRIMHFQGTTDANGLRIAIVVSRFNDFVTDRLLAARRRPLRRGADAVDTVSVPGAYEIPQAARTRRRQRGPTMRSSASVPHQGGKRRTSSTSRGGGHGIMWASAETGVR